MFLVRGLFYRLLFCLIVLPLGYFSCVGNRHVQGHKSYFESLTGDSARYWDPYYTFENKLTGRGWYFSRDSLFVEFNYADNERSKLDYGDIYWEGFRFDVRKDTLFIKDYNDYAFVILKLNEDSLIVRDVSRLVRYSYLDTILFVKSDDQSTRPK